MKQLACAVALHPDGMPMRLALASDQPMPPMTEFDGDAAPIATRHLFNTLGLETRNAIAIGMSAEVSEAASVHFVLCRIAPPCRTHWKHLQANGTLVTASWVPFQELPSNSIVDWIKEHL